MRDFFLKRNKYTLYVGLELHIRFTLGKKIGHSTEYHITTDPDYRGAPKYTLCNVGSDPKKF